MLVEVYGDTAPTDKSYWEWFRRFKDGNFSDEDKPRSGQPKKFEDKELEALLEEDQSQTQEKLAESLGITQQAVLYDWEPWEWFKNKEIGCLMNWNREILKGDFSLAKSWFKDNREKVFCIGLWLEMRSGYSTTTPRRKNTTLSLVNRCHWPQHQHHGRTFMVRRSCSVSDGTKRILFTMSYWNLAIPLRAIGISYTWFVWVIHCEKNGRNTSKDMIKLFFFMSMLGLMSLKS